MKDIQIKRLSDTAILPVRNYSDDAGDMMSKIKSVARAHIKEYLYNYKWLNKEINTIRLSIINPYLEKDINVGGGRSNLPTSINELTAIKLADNARLSQLELIKWAIDDVYRQLDDTGKEFVKLYYFNKNVRNLKLNVVAREIGLSERTATRLNTKIIIEIAERIGWS